MELRERQLGLKESSPEFERSGLRAKLINRIESGNSPDVVCLDVDGTVYTKEMGEDGRWQKNGDNTELSEHLAGGNIPHILISARPDWNHESDMEMEKLNLSAADAVVAGAGSVIYWRDPNGQLVVDEEFSELMKEQKISFKKDNQLVEETYQPEHLVDIIGNMLAEYSNSGFQRAKVDRHSQGGFVTLDITEMPFTILQEMIRKVKENIAGLKLTFSEDLEHVSSDTFTGWVQILPQNGGKDGATRYILDKIARGINPAGTDEKKLNAYIFGDSAVDKWMLGLGVGHSHSYRVNQYLLGNNTPHAYNKLRALADACSGEVDESDRDRISHLRRNEELQSYQEKLRATLNRLTGSAEPDNYQQIREIRAELHRIATVLYPGYRSANLKIIEQPGPTGVLEIARKL